MKKLNVLLLVTILLSLTFIKSHAEFTAGNFRNMAAGEIGILIKYNRSAPKAVSLKAEKNFAKSYQQAIETEWSVLQDKSLMCRFFLNGTPQRAFYTAHGQWMYTISSYDGSKLAKAVSDNVRSAYYNSRIVFVNQIDGANGKTVYVVEIQDDKSIRKLRVDDNGMEVIQEFEKN